jgi:hypothetical protein
VTYITSNLDERFLIHPVNLSRSAGGCHGVLPYRGLVNSILARRLG